ncbi:MAG: Deblocking aminopeptidase [Clostridia bacterium]|jgi:endoglucanase|nr:Deblocking aminopeptidase [Clostridia bacterium]
MKLLKELCHLNGLSGDEEDVRNYILKQIAGKCEAHTDKLGNIIAFKKGIKAPDKKILFEAHTDEVGYMITSIDDDGLIHFGSVGVPENVIPGKTVIIKSTKNPEEPYYIKGVIGIVPVHRTKAENMNKIPELKSLYIDIGAKKKDEVEKIIELGDSVYFDGEFSTFGNFIKGKALDDRIGCHALIRLIKEPLEYDTWFSFCVQEEIGCRGSETAAYTIKPDYTFILEGTTAADIGGTEDSDKVCFLGKGPVISFADGGTIYDPEMIKRVTDIADKNNLKWQFKKYMAGGNDASMFQRTAGGSKVIAISAPVRYIHSRISVACFKDIEGMFELCKAITKGGLYQ